MKRTIKECLEDSLQTMDLNGKNTIAFPLPFFLRSMAIVLLADADMRLRISNDVGPLKLRAVAKPKFGDYVAVLNHDDFFRSVAQLQQLMDFLAWLLGQEEPEESCDGAMWYDDITIMNMWNTYAREHANQKPDWEEDL